MTGNGTWVPEEIPVVLPRELEDFVREQVAKNAYFDPSHLIAEALYRYRDVVLANGIKHEELKALLRVGANEADRGELADGPGVLDRLRAKLGAPAGQPT